MSGEPSDSDVHISRENQKKINRFAIMNGWVEEYNDLLAAKQKLLSYVDDAENELLVSDAGETDIPMLVGESFVLFTNDEVNVNLEELREKTKKEVAELEKKVRDIKSEMDTLKAALYEQFGNNINLENDGGPPIQQNVT